MLSRVNVNTLFKLTVIVLLVSIVTKARLGIFYAFAVIFLFVLLYLIFDAKKPVNFPPGLRWYPIVGCAIKLSKLRKKHGLFCKVIEELAQSFKSPGGVYGFKLGKDKLVVAYNPEAIQGIGVNEDLDGRPDGVFFRSRTFNSRKGIMLTDEGFWEEQRRFILRHLKDFGFTRSTSIVVIQEEAQYLVDDLNRRISSSGIDGIIVPMHDLFQVFILNSLWRLMASKRYDRDSKKVMQLLAMFYELLRNVNMIGAMFGHFPFMRYLAPEYSGFNAFVESHKRFYEFLREEMEEHRKSLDLTDALWSISMLKPLKSQKYQCDAPRDLMDAYLMELAKPEHTESFSEEQLLSVCLDLFLAGSETTNKSLGFAFLHMVKNPDIQRKAQAELDAVVGRGRQPSWEDRAKLPYCEAIVYEAIRFFIGHTFGVPHRALRDTQLCGYDIPKDTMVVACFHGMFMNSKLFPEPRRFNPDRYFVDGKFKPYDASPFGYGRHRCMGETMAKQNMFFYVTTMLHNFTFSLPKGDLIPDEEPLDGVTAAVQPFNALIVARQ